MTIAEYNEKYKILNEEYEKNIKSIKKEFAFSNNIVKTGDIIRDSYKIIKVEEVRWSTSTLNNVPSQCVYLGIELKIDLSPKKKKPLQSSVYQSNLEEIIKND